MLSAVGELYLFTFCMSVDGLETWSDWTGVWKHWGAEGEAGGTVGGQWGGHRIISVKPAHGHVGQCVRQTGMVSFESGGSTHRNMNPVSAHCLHNGRIR